MPTLICLSEPSLFRRGVLAFHLLLFLLPGLAAAETVGLYEVYEAKLPVSTAYENPFDTDEVQVDALIRTPDGEIVHPCFFYRPAAKAYEPFGATRRIVTRPVRLGQGWRLRYAPMVTGEHAIRIRVRDAEGERVEEFATLQVEPSDHRGFIRARGNGFFFDNGDRYYPIGFQQAWSQPIKEGRAYFSWGNGQDSIDGFRWFYAIAGRYGANWNRMWIDCGNWAHPSVQVKENEVQYGDAWLLDQIMEEAEKNGIAVQMMLGRYAQPVPLYEKYLRYVIARWGASPAVLSWELKNENWWTAGHGYTDEVRWTTDMAAIIDRLDPYDHIITTSHWEDAVKEKAPIYRLEPVGYYSDHKYFVDEVEPTVWYIPQGSPHVSKVARSEPTAMRMFPDAGTVHGPTLSIEGDRTYTLTAWAKTRDLEFTGRVSVAARLFDKNNQIVGKTHELRLGKGTQDWKEHRLEIPVPGDLDVVGMKLYLEQGGLSDGEAIFDDLRVVDETGQTIFVESFTWSEETDLSLARRIFNRGKWVANFELGVPIIGGEFGLKRQTDGKPFRSPFVHGIDETGKVENRVHHAWDRNGLHAREWLWASIMSWDGATSMWWWVEDALHHTYPVRVFIDRVDPAFHALSPAASWEIVSPLRASRDEIRACGRVGDEQVYAFVYHRDSTWDRAIKEGIEAEPVTGEIRISGCKAGTWEVRWFDTRYADLTRERSPFVQARQISVGSDGVLKVPVEGIEKDFALMGTRAGN